MSTDFSPGFAKAPANPGTRQGSLLGGEAELRAVRAVLAADERVESDQKPLPATIQCRTPMNTRRQLTQSDRAVE